MKLIKSVALPVLVLALASLLIYMSGLAAVQHKCQVGNTPQLTWGVFGMSAGTDDCVRAYRFSWFTFAFAFATLMGILATMFVGKGLHASRSFWVGMLSISTLLMMIASETFLGFTIRTEDEDDSVYPQWVHRIRTTSVGAIMSVAFLVFLMMVVGTECSSDNTSRADEAAVDKPVPVAAQV